MTKTGKIIIGTTVGILGASAVVAIPTVVAIQNKNTSTNSTTPTRPSKPSKPGSINNGNWGSQTVSPFSFSTYQVQQTKVDAKPIFEREAPVRITKEFKSGWVPVRKGSDDLVYQTSEYYNERNFMPILNDSWKMRNYANERDTGAVLYNRYYGWDDTKSYFDLRGKQLSLNEYKNHALTYITYSATQALKEEFTLQQDFIRMVMLDCSLFNKEDNANQINEYLKHAANAGIKFVTLKNLSQQQLENVQIPFGIKKLTILDHDTWNFNKSQLESLRGILIPESVEELEVYSNTCNKVDPLILSTKTHMIYDHITDLNNYYVNQANFTTIDLSKHEQLSDENLQKAIDIVYGERQYERAFHGNFVGGYISNLDLSNTGVTTLNNVVIPSQSDGRFNIAYVKWTGNNGSGTSQIIINDTNQPSNDSLVGEWYNPSNNIQEVTKLVVKTVRSVTVADATKEILGQIKRFPNINTIDVKSVWLQDGSFTDLENAVKAALTSEDGTVKEITFIKE